MLDLIVRESNGLSSKMKSRAAILVVALIALILLYALVDPTRTVVGRVMGDEFYDGRPSRYWSAQLTGGPAEQSEARETLASGGAEAWPVLRDMYDSATDAELQIVLLELMGDCGAPAAEVEETLVGALQTEDPHVQGVALSAIPKAGISADVAVPTIVKFLTSENSVIASRALSEYKSAAAPALPELLAVMHDESLNTEARWNAIRTIGKIGPDAISSLPDLIAALDDEEDTIREHSAEAIGDIGPTTAEEGVPALIPMLKDPATRVRRDAVRSLGYIGEASRVAVPQIIELIDDPEEIVRDAAKTALETIAPEEAAALEDDTVPDEAGSESGQAAPAP